MKNSKWMRLLSFMLAVIMTAGVMNFSVFAGDLGTTEATGETVGTTEAEPSADGDNTTSEKAMDPAKYAAEPVAPPFTGEVPEGKVAYTNGEFYDTLQKALTAAEDGAEVWLLADVKENVEVNSKSFTLHMGGHTITGAKAGNNAVVQIIGGEGVKVELYNGTITGGKPSGSGSSATGGRGLNAFNADVTLNGVTVTGNKGAQRINPSYNVNGEYLYGAGIYVSGTTLKMVGCTVSDNESVSTPNNKDGGGIYALSSTVNMTGCLVSGNSTPAAGAGLCLSTSNATVTDCVFTENAATSTGAGVSISGGNFTSKNTDYIKNQGVGTGVAIYDNSNSNKGKNIVIDGGTFADNFSSTKGSTLITLSANITIKNAKFTGNSTGTLISHTAASGETTTSYLGNLTITENKSKYPLISFSDISCSLTIENCRIENNPVASGNLITLATEGEGSVNKISGCTIKGNTLDGTSSAKAVIYLSRRTTGSTKAFTKTETTFENCTIENNTGIYNAPMYLSQQNITITGGTISGNTGKSAGGIYVLNGTDVTVKDTQVVRNTATNTYSSAGGIFNDGKLTLDGVLVSENVHTYAPTGTSTASVAGGITNNSNASLTLRDTVIKENKGVTGGIYESGGNYNHFTFESGALYNNVNHKEEVSDLFTYYKADYQTYIPANEMKDGDFDFSGYTWSLNGKKADVPNASSNAASRWNVVEDENSAIVEIVHSDGSTTPYTDFIEAFHAVAEGETIRLLKQKVYTKNFMKLTGKSFTIDLNGKELYLDSSVGISNALFTIQNGRTLTIKGSGVVGQFIMVGDRAGSSERYAGHLVIDADGDIKIASLRTGSDYTPVTCVNGDVTVKGSGRIEELNIKVTYVGAVTVEKGVTVGTLNITSSSSLSGGEKEVVVNGDVDLLNLSQSGASKAALNGTVGKLILRHLRSGSAATPETYAGDGFKLAGELEFYPVDFLLRNTSATSGFKIVDMAKPTEATPDVVILIGNLAGKVDTSKAIWYNTIGGVDSRDLVWATDKGGNGLNYYDLVKVETAADGNLVLHKHYLEKMVFLSGDGNDTNDGLTKETAVKTFDKAKTVANNLGVSTIYIVKPVHVSGTETWDGDGKLMLQRASVDIKDAGNLIVVDKNGTLTLKNIVIDGASEIGEYKTHAVSGSLIEVHGILNLEAGTTLQHNKKTENGNDYTDVGGAIYANGGTVNMYDGSSINDCSASFGGGVGLYYNAVFNMHGGTISGNSALGTSNASGGGVMLAYDSEMNMFGGEISGNTSSYWGGGIALGANSDVLVRGGGTTLNLKGGTISNNVSSSNGGGIFIQVNCTANIEADADHQVYITNNTCNSGVFGGGGIYVNGISSTSGTGLKNGVVNLKKVEIANNTAGSAAFPNLGGAIAACPSSNVSIYLRNGAVMYGNIGSSTLYVNGSMQVGISGTHKGSPHIILSDYMLGGARYNWVSLIGKLPQINEYAEYRLSSSSVWALSSNRSGDENIVKNGIKLTNVHITGNVSKTVGGAIGSNGDIVIGTDNTGLRLEKLLDGEYAYKHLNEEFSFEITFGNALPANVTILRNGVEENDALTQVAEKANTYSFTMKADDVILISGIDEGITYTVTETDEKGANLVTVDYTESLVGMTTHVGKSVSGMVLGNNSVTSVVFTNTYSAGSIKIIKGIKGNFANAANKVFTFTVTGPSYPDGKDVTITGAGEYLLEGLEPGEYTVTEKDASVPGYVLTVTGNDQTVEVKAADVTVVEINNYYDRRLIDIKVVKNWKEEDGTTEALDDLPKSVKVQLYVGEGENKVPVADGERTLTAVGKWTVTFTDLPEYDDDGENKLVYTVEEVDVPNGWIKVADAAADNGYTITNKRVPTSIEVEKIWKNVDHESVADDEAIPESITLYLYRSDWKVVYDTVTLRPDEDGSWSYKWENLPQYNADGEQITYRVEEKAVTGWTADAESYTPDEYGKITITNTRDTTSVDVTKTWTNAAGASNEDTWQPESITVQLKRNGSDYGEAVTITPDEDGKWYHKWEGLPKLDENGHEYEYTVEEFEVTGWTCSVGEPVQNGDGSYSISITNTRETVSITVKKEWHEFDNTVAEEDLPESITARLLRNGTEIDTFVLNAENGWKHTWNDLPTHDANGNPYTYVVDEKEVPAGWTKSFDGNTIINTRGVIDVTINKVWLENDGETTATTDLPDYIVAQLYRKTADGEEEAYGTPFRINKSVSEDGSTYTYTYTWNNLPTHSADGKVYTYTVEEVSVQNGWKCTVLPTETDENGNFVVTVQNVREVTSVTVNKVWHDQNGNTTEDVPESITVQLYRNGTAYGAVETLSENGWSHTWDDLPKYDANGDEYDYTVVEVNVPDGWTTTVSDNVNGVITITNTREVMSVTVEKVWYEADGTTPAEKDIPGSITVQLKRNGVNDGTAVTFDADDDWTHTWTGLPTHSADGTPYTYTVEEVNVPDGWKLTSTTGSAAAGYVITNTRIPTSIEVEKVWVNVSESNSAEAIPGAITLYLMRDDMTAPYKTQEVTPKADGSWSYKWEDLPQYNADGDPITYTVKEEKVTGWAADKEVYAPGEDGRITITNTRETTSVNVVKTWIGTDGNRTTETPRAITVQLRRNGVDYGAAVELTADGGWSHTWNNLPTLDEKGVAYTYTVVETDVPAGWTCVTGEPVKNADGSFSIAIRNTRIPTSVTVEKVWLEHGGAAATQNIPGSITAQLLRNGTVIATETLSTANNWTFTWSNLPTHSATGELYTYTVDETNVPAGWNKTIEGNTLINTREVTRVTVNKVWHENGGAAATQNIPGSITAQLLRNGTVIATETLSTANNWTFTWSNLPTYDAQGNAYTYTVDETNVPAGWNKTVAGTTITNTREVTRVTVNKVWHENGGAAATQNIPGSITAQLLRDGTVVDTFVLDEGNNWTHTWTGLPTHDAEGNAYTYTVDEANVPAGWTKSVNGTTITNTRNVTSVSVNKVWHEADGTVAAENIPGSITAQLLRNGTVIDSATLNAANNWTFTWTGLPTHDAEGNEYTYTVDEAAVPAGWTKSVNGTTITNTREVTSVEVEKVWMNEDGTEAEAPEGAEITVVLVVNGVPTETTITLNAANGWSGSFSSLPVYDAEGNEIVYTVDEVEFEGWTTEITQDENGVWVITNTLPTPAPAVTTVEVEKVWVNENGDVTEAPEGAEITVVLVVNGIPTETTITLSAANGWAGSFNDLPVYDAEGNEIEYTVEEVEFEGWTTEIEQDENGVWVITNTEEPTDIPDNPPPLVDIPDEPKPPLTEKPPQTGDEDSIVLTVILTVSMIGMAITLGEYFLNEIKRRLGIRK